MSYPVFADFFSRDCLMTLHLPGLLVSSSCCVLLGSLSASPLFVFGALSPPCPLLASGVVGQRWPRARGHTLCRVWLVFSSPASSPLQIPVRVPALECHFLHHPPLSSSSNMLCLLGSCLSVELTVPPDNPAEKRHHLCLFLGPTAEPRLDPVNSVSSVIALTSEEHRPQQEHK